MNATVRSRKAPALGSKKPRRNGRYFGVTFDEEMAAAIRKQAEKHGCSFSEQVRVYCQWGLDTDAGE